MNYSKQILLPVLLVLSLENVNAAGWLDKVKAFKPNFSSVTAKLPDFATVKAGVYSAASKAANKLSSFDVKTKATAFAKNAVAKMNGATRNQKIAAAVPAALAVTYGGYKLASRFYNRNKGQQTAAPVQNNFEPEPVAVMLETQVAPEVAAALERKAEVEAPVLTNEETYALLLKDFLGKYWNSLHQYYEQFSSISLDFFYSEEYGFTCGKQHPCIIDQGVNELENEFADIKADYQKLVEAWNKLVL